VTPLTGECGNDSFLHTSYQTPINLLNSCSHRFAVTLTEDCGILERVPTVAPLCSNGSRSSTRSCQFSTEPLHIQCRFAVTPLTEDCGILEWVPNVAPLRDAVERMYKLDKLFDRTTNTTIRTMWEGYPKVRRSQNFATTAAPRRAHTLDEALEGQPANGNRQALVLPAAVGGKTQKFCLHAVRTLPRNKAVGRTCWIRCRRCCLAHV